MKQRHLSTISAAYKLSTISSGGSYDFSLLRLIMSNSDAAGNESSSSNPLPPPTEASPLCRRGGGGELAPHLSPHGRGSPPIYPWEMALFTPPRPRAPPIMGAPGTAFGPYRPPPPQWPSPGSGHAASGSRRYLGFHTVPAGGGVAAVGGGIRIGGSLSGKKRAREGGASGGSGGNGAGDGIVQHCSVCNKGFGSSKALFGHMRSHPDRGWKGVHPPPSFRAEEEFADIRMAAAAAAAAVEAEAESAPPKEAEDEAEYRVPDLNHPPPPDSN